MEGKRLRHRLGHQKVASAVFSVLFIACMIGISYATLSHPEREISFYENRSLAKFPEATKETIGNGEWFQDIDKYLCDQAAMRDRILELSALADYKLFHRPSVNEILPLNGPLLPFWNYEEVEEERDAVQEAAEDEAEQLKRLEDAVSGYGGTFLFVAVPNQYIYFKDDYPAYMNNHAEYIDVVKDIFFSELADRGISYLDVGDVWEVDGNPRNYVSYGDHHWTLDGGLSAYKALISRLNSITGYNLRTLENKDLIRRTLPNPCLGTRERKICEVVDTKEAMEYFELVQTVPFRRWDNGVEVEATTFELPATPTETVTDSVYMGGDTPEIVIKTDRPELPSCLMYGDSFTNFIETLLYASFDETRYIDLRIWNKEPLLTYVLEHKPEVVICLRDYGVMADVSGNGQIT